jgi:RNA polymerase sigma-70 factor (ECF subfamily)
LRVQFADLENSGSSMNFASMSPQEVVIACLRTDDEDAWAEFIHRFNPLITRIALRVARQWGESSPQVIDDLVQETYLKLCAERTNFLQKFKSAHNDAIFGYIKVFTANLAIDHFKASKSHKRGGGTITDSIDGDVSDRTGMNAISPAAILDRDLLLQQVQACLNSIALGSFGERDRRIFWLYYRVGLTASAIATIPTIGLTVKGVESTLLRLTQQLRVRLANRPQSPSASDFSGRNLI